MWTRAGARTLNIQVVTAVTVRGCRGEGKGVRDATLGKGTLREGQRRKGVLKATGRNSARCGQATVRSSNGAVEQRVSLSGTRTATQENT